MGEAKRRKQILGKQYGEVPPVLMPDSQQFNDHGRKFVEAFFDHLKQYPNKLSTLLLQKPDEQIEPSDLNDSLENQAVEQWLEDYLKSYRKRDRAQLAGVLLSILLIRLSKGPQHKEEDAEIESSQFIINLILYLFCFNALKSFLSGPIRKDHEEMLLKLHAEMKMEINADQSIDTEDQSEELDMLSKLFHPILEPEKEE